MKTLCVGKKNQNNLGICRDQGKNANGGRIPYVYLEVINQANKLLYKISFILLSWQIYLHNFLEGWAVSWNIGTYWNSRLEMWCWGESQLLAHGPSSSFLIPGSITHLPFFGNNAIICPLASPPQTCLRLWSILQSLNSGKRTIQVQEGLWVICPGKSGDQ